MSIGFGACANLIITDISGLLYAYSCFNINLKNHEEARKAEDGEIWISRDALIEPVIHEKLKKLPSGRKKTIIKRIPRPAPIYELIKAGKIRIRNASGTWKTEGTIDMMAINLVWKIFVDYQLQGETISHEFIFY